MRKSNSLYPSGAEFITTDQNVLVILGMVSSLRTAELSSGFNPFNINMRGRDPEMCHLTSTPSTTLVISIGRSTRIWNREDSGVWTLAGIGSLGSTFLGKYPIV